MPPIRLRPSTVYCSEVQIKNGYGVSATAMVLENDSVSVKVTIVMLVNDDATDQTTSTDFYCVQFRGALIRCQRVAVMM
jgi:hypothetical protein